MGVVGWIIVGGLCLHFCYGLRASGDGSVAVPRQWLWSAGEGDFGHWFLEPQQEVVGMRFHGFFLLNWGRDSICAGANGMNVTFTGVKLRQVLGTVGMSVSKAVEFVGRLTPESKTVWSEATKASAGVTNSTGLWLPMWHTSHLLNPSAIDRN